MLRPALAVISLLMLLAVAPLSRADTTVEQCDPALDTVGCAGADDLAFTGDCSADGFNGGRDDVFVESVAFVHVGATQYCYGTPNGPGDARAVSAFVGTDVATAFVQSYNATEPGWSSAGTTAGVVVAGVSGPSAVVASWGDAHGPGTDYCDTWVAVINWDTNTFQSVNVGCPVGDAPAAPIDAPWGALLP